MLSLRRENRVSNKSPDFKDPDPKSSTNNTKVTKRMTRRLKQEEENWKRKRVERERKVKVATSPSIAATPPDSPANDPLNPNNNPTTTTQQITTTITTASQHSSPITPPPLSTNNNIALTTSVQQHDTPREDTPLESERKDNEQEQLAKPLPSLPAIVINSQGMIIKPKKPLPSPPPIQPSKFSIPLSPKSLPVIESLSLQDSALSSTLTPSSSSSSSSSSLLPLSARSNSPNPKLQTRQIVEKPPIPAVTRTQPPLTSDPLAQGYRYYKPSHKFLQEQHERKLKREDEKRKRDGEMQILASHIKSIETELQKIAQERKILSSRVSSGSSKGVVQVDDDFRKEVASNLLKSVDSTVFTVIPVQTELMENAITTKSRMEEEKIRREKKRIATQLLKENSEIKEERFLAVLEALKADDRIMHLEKTEARLKNDLYRLRLLCGNAGEASSSRANMQQERLRREKKKLNTPITPRLDISDCDSSSSSPSTPSTKKLPPIKDGLFVKSAEVIKLSQAPPPKSISRLERMREESRRRRELVGTPVN